MTKAESTFLDVIIKMAARIAELEEAIKTHRDSTHFCERCGEADSCSTDDVCGVLKDE